MDVKTITHSTTGATLKRGQLMLQWGALWLILDAEQSTDNDVWLSLQWVAGSTNEGETTTVFYGNDEPVRVVTVYVI